MKGLSGRIGGYRILAHWASSPGGEIYAVRSSARSPDEILALEIGPPEQDDSLRERLLAELRVLTAFSHPEFARIHEVFEYEQRIVVVTEFVRGETLAQVMRTEGRGLQPILAVSIATELAVALHEAHTWSGEVAVRRHLIHGDVCPANIMFGYDGRVVMLRVGLALARSRIKYDRGTIRGHYAYMSPERAQGIEIDARTDVYSLGLILFEMLTGTAAIRGGTESELLQAAIKPKIQPLCSLVKCSRALEAIVDDALATNRTDRCASAEQLACALSELKSRRSATWKVESEVEKLMIRHFDHKARAMQTLIRRWSARPVSPPPAAREPDPGRSARPPPNRDTVSRAGTRRPIAAVRPPTGMRPVPVIREITSQRRDAQIPPPSRSAPEARVSMNLVDPALAPDPPVQTDDLSMHASTDFGPPRSRTRGLIVGVAILAFVLFALALATLLWPQG